MTLRDFLDVLTAFGTLVLAVFTGFLAWATVRLAKDTKEAAQEQIKAMREVSSSQIKTWQDQSKEQIGVRTWLTMEAHFDSKEMKQQRKALAYQMASYSPQIHREITDDVFDLFESIATAYNNGFLNHDLTVSSFSYHGLMWWEAGKAYVHQERRNLGGDATTYEEFEKFAEKMAKYSQPIDESDLQTFLDGEKTLCFD